MKSSEFADERPGRLILIPEGGHAFVPAPAPRKMALDSQTVSVLAEASQSLGVLKGVGQTLPSATLFVRLFIRREAELSSRIEGTYATQQELVLFEVNPEGEPSKPDVREVSNYVASLDHGLKRLTELPVCLRMVRELHEQLMRAVRGSEKGPGEFRTRQNWIGQHDQSIAHARYVPPPVKELHDCLSDFEKLLHDEHNLPFLVRLAIIHYQFEAIHPFLDGNGRVGRLLLPLLLAEKKVLPQPLLHLSAFFEQHRTEYYEGLLDVSRKGAWQAWIQFFLRAVIAQAEEAADRAKQLLDLREEYREKAQTINSSARILKLVDGLFLTPGLEISATAKSLDLSFPTVQSYVSDLVEAGILHEVTGQKRNRIFLATGIFRVMNRQAKK